MTDSESVANENPTARVSARRRWWRWPLRTLVALVLAGAVGIGLAAWTLTRHPIESTVVAEVVANRLAALFGGERQVDVGVVGLALGESMQPEVFVRDIRIVRPNDIAVSVNSLRIETRWQTLSGGPVAVRSVHIDRLLVRNIGPNVTLPTVEQVLEAVRRLVAELGLEYFEIGSFTFRDEVSGRPARERFGNVSITADAVDGQHLTAQAIALGTEGTMSLEVGVHMPTPGHGFKLDLRSHNFDLADLLTMFGQGEPAAFGAGNIDTTFELDPTGGIVSGHGELAFGPLRTRGGGGEDISLMPVPVRLEMTWNADRKALELNPSSVVFDTGHFIASGAILPPADGGSLWSYDFTMRGPDPLAEQRIAVGQLTGTFDSATSDFAIDNLHFSGSGTSFTAAVRGSVDEGHRYLVLSGISPRLPVQTLKALWPPLIASDTRSWIVDNIREGVLTDARIDIAANNADIEAGRPGTASLAFSFANGAFLAYDGGPVIRDVNGRGRVDATGSVIDVDTGWADFGKDRRLTLMPSLVAVPFGKSGPPQGHIEVNFSGPAGAGFSLLNTLPLADVVDLHLDPARVGGDISARLILDLPFVAGLAEDDIRAGGRIELSDWVPGQPILGHTIQNGDITIDIDGNEAHVTGSAKVDGAPADLDLRQPLDGEGAARSIVRLQLDEAARKALGIDLGGMLTGPLVATIESTGQPSGDIVGIDLAKVALDLSSVGYVKPAGRPGKLSFRMKRQPNGETRIEDLAFSAGAASISGDMVFDADGVVSADLPRCTIVDGDRLSIKAARQSNGGYKITLNGSSLDGRGLVNAVLRPSGAPLAVERPLIVAATLDRVSGFNGEALTGVNLSAEIVGSSIASLSATVQSGGASASATITPDGRRGRLRVEAGDVGNLLRFLDIYGRIYGGRAVVAGSFDAEDRLVANVDGSNWKVVDEPALARLSTASAGGAAQGLAKADIRRLLFSLDFDDGRLKIVEGYLRTDSAGLTMNGDVDFTKDVLRLAGSYLPASQLDRLLGALPILGWTLYNGGHAGLLGVTYRLAGPINAPELTVNPLSAVAPGIFRKLFELK